MVGYLVQNCLPLAQPWWLGHWSVTPMSLVSHIYKANFVVVNSYKKDSPTRAFLALHCCCDFQLPSMSNTKSTSHHTVSIIFNEQSVIIVFIIESSSTHSFFVRFGELQKNIQIFYLPFLLLLLHFLILLHRHDVQ